MKAFGKMKMTVAVMAAIALALALPVFADDDEAEEEVALSDCPAEVQNTINNYAAGGSVLEVEKETSKDGAVTYEAEIKNADGKTVEIGVSSDGQLIEEETEDDDDGEEDDDAEEAAGK